MKTFTSVKEIKVSIDFGPNPEKKTLSVGRLAIRDRKIYFEYDAAFIRSGLELSPLRLPLKSGLQSFDPHLFEGLPGLFNDSLPDGWGRLLFDRFARSQGIISTDVSPLDRLAYIGNTALGALVYEPDHSDASTSDAVSLDELAVGAQEILEGETSEVLQELLRINGSSGGARPKALIGVNDDFTSIIHGVGDLSAGYAPWMVKFPNTQDGPDAGAIEYAYAMMARAAGVSMPDVHLFDAKTGPGYFAIKRYDREGGQRFHVHSACGLLHSDFRTPSLDYEDLIALTNMLTRDVREAEKMFQLAVFNVMAYNRDDHSKNFSYLMDEEGHWRLSPAYDLTFSSGPSGEQSTMVMGQGRNPGVDNLKKLGEAAKLSPKRVDEIIDQTKAALSQWDELAHRFGVSTENIALIKSKFRTT